VAALVDTNVLVYCFDRRYPSKREKARTLVREGIAGEATRLCHQTIVEFVSAVTRPQKDGPPLLTDAEAWHEAEALLAEHEILFPTDAVVRTALRGAATYRLSWFDAHLWAYAECFGLDEILTEDFQDGRLYGTVKAVNPFL
jgi:predicted nucleic acid-binding protein